MRQDKLSIYLCRLLRHAPGDAGLDMDRHGWVSTQQLIDNVSRAGRYHLTMSQLEQLVANDSKGRYRFSPDKRRIKACQGHSIPWVEPELTPAAPPACLYHGTTEQAWRAIQESGYISRMSRHAVHMQSEVSKAWQSARRWRQAPVVLKIDARAMAADGIPFGLSDNGVWCTERVEQKYVCDVLRPSV